MNHIDLFAGIGGFSLAAQWVGWKTVGWCENNPHRQNILRQNFPGLKEKHSIKENFTEFNGKVDITTGGFPCKQTSIGAAIHGKRNGLDGNDSGLWYHELRVFEEIGSAWVVVENPSGVAKWHDQIQGGLENIGYTVSRVELCAYDFGLPHQRKRYFYVGNSNGKRLEIARPKGSPTSDWYKRLAAAGGDWMSAAPGIIGGFNGVPNRVDRTEAIGNSCSPLQALEVFKKIIACVNPHPNG